MTKIFRDKFDLLTLGIKQQLIGTEIIMDDGIGLEIIDYYIDYATSEIHINFIDGTGGSFNLNEKYMVNVPISYISIPSKIKTKKHKKK